MGDNTALNADVSKAFEGLLPGLTDIIQNRNFRVTVRRTGPNTVEVVQGEAAYELSDSLIEQMNMMINIASLVDGQGKQAS